MVVRQDRHMNIAIGTCCCCSGAPAREDVPNLLAADTRPRAFRYVWNSDEIQEVLTHVRQGMGMSEDMHYLSLANATFEDVRDQVLYWH